MSNRIIIGTGKKGGKKEEGQNRYEAKNPQLEAEAMQVEVRDTAQEAAEESEPIPVDENVWGNDHTILTRLDEKQLADRRLYVRVRHMQRVECHMVFDSPEVEPVTLEQPIIFIISDLSMGGIGIISEHYIDTGKILAIPLTLDNIPYQVKCEVVYCFRNEEKYRAGLKIVQRDKHFIRHLKIFIARVSLNSAYGKKED